MHPKFWQYLLFLLSFGPLIVYLGVYIESDIILQEGWSFMQNAIYLELSLSLGIGIVIMIIIRATSPRTFTLGKAGKIFGAIVSLVFLIHVITHNILQGSWWYGVLFGIPFGCGIFSFSEYEKFNRKQMAGMVICLIGAVMFMPVPYLADREYIQPNYRTTIYYNWQIPNGSMNPLAARIVPLIENGTFMPALNWTWQTPHSNTTIMNASDFQPALGNVSFYRNVPLHIGWNDSWHFLYNCTIANFSQPLYVNYWWEVTEFRNMKSFSINGKWWNLSKDLFYQYIYLNASYFPDPLFVRNITVASGILVSQYFNWTNSPCIPLEQRQWWILDLQGNVMLIVRERMGQVCTLSEETMII